MSEAKPCPFCGKEPHIYASYGLISCRNKECIADATNGEATLGFIEQWNTRPIEDALNKRIAELEEAQRWIPVSERLPDVGKVVHVISMNYIEYFTKTELVYETAVLVEIDGVKMFGFVNEFSVWSSGDVTHWMYAMTLPQPPEVQE